MNGFDIIIIIMVVTAAVLGAGFGFIRTASLAVGGVAGLYIGAIFSSRLLFLTTTSMTRMVVLVLITLAVTALFVDIAVHAGDNLHRKFSHRRGITPVNRTLGSLLAVFTLMISLAPIATMLEGSTVATLKGQVTQSRIGRFLDTHLPGVRPDIFNRVAYLLDPYGFPVVFAEGDPKLERATNKLSPEQFNAIVAGATNSVVKVESPACGINAIGSGFIVGGNLVVTNAHVVAGNKDGLSVYEKGQRRSGEVIWFDPQLDLAMIHTVYPLHEAPLKIATRRVGDTAHAVIIGYPGGAYGTQEATIIRRLRARGYDIYNDLPVVRQVYALDSHVVPGNSGGPLIGMDGQVIGVVFGHSAAQEHIGYALTTQGLTDYIELANRNIAPVDTGSCSGRD